MLPRCRGLPFLRLSSPPCLYRSLRAPRVVAHRASELTPRLSYGGRLCFAGRARDDDNPRVDLRLDLVPRVNTVELAVLCRCATHLAQPRGDGSRTAGSEQDHRWPLHQLAAWVWAGTSLTTEVASGDFDAVDIGVRLLSFGATIFVLIRLGGSPCPMSSGVLRAGTNAQPRCHVEA